MEKLDKESRAIRKDIEKIYKAMEQEVTLYDLNQYILWLNADIEKVSYRPDPELVESIRLLQQQIIDYESHYEGDFSLEMIASFKEGAP